MRYYVEINGESSLDIQGLMIQSLPSISKPLMRSKQETIDGRDGDIVTKLGYSAYDKTLKIGLWGNYDINEVIAFFNQEGTITFSNEPDKYYRFTILNRDDYVSQLDKFRTCTIALHCQPYKYKLNEEAEELENEYVEQEGTSLSFNNSLVAPMEIDLKGNTLQNGTPTPSSPIPINNVSGDNQIVVCGKNSFNIQTLVKGRLDNGVIGYASNTTDLTLNENSFSFTTNANYRGVSTDFIKVEGTEYIVHCTQPSTLLITTACYDRNKTYLRDAGISYIPQHNNQAKISIQSDVAFIRINIYLSQAGTITIENPQLEKSFIPTTYEAYNGTTYNIDLPVENLFDKDNITSGKRLYYYQGEVSLIDDANYCVSDYIPVKPNTKYSVNYTMSAYTRMVYYNSNKNAITANESDSTFTTHNTCAYIRLSVALTNLDTAQLEEGGKVNSFVPYGTTPIELNKIGTYQDYIYKENDKWYLHKEIGKVVLDGTTNSFTNRYTTNTNNYYRHVWENGSVKNQPGGTIANAYCNKLSPVSIGSTYGCNQGVSINDINHRIIMYITDIREMTIEQANQWLKTNNIIVYYLIDTPTNTEITYTPLIEQLENIKNAMSKEGTTNVNQVNNDAPFIINASVLSGTDSITLTNEGNATSKPTITITGSGVVGVYLENIQMFNISLGTNETIIIDTENMEAYYGSQLKNRQVTGDYSNFALQSGTNNLKFTGLVTNVEITNYNRWI